MAWRPVPAVSTVIPRPLKDAAERENVPDIVIDDQNFLPDQRIIGTMEPVQHSLLFLRQIGDHTMQEQRRLIE